MIEIKFVGRGGQGAVVASELLARACFEQGLYPQSFSIFGGERRGSAVAAFVRVDREKIHLKCDIENPDHLVCFDRSLLTDELVSQVNPNGMILLNTAEVTRFPGVRTGCIDALAISREVGLGPIVNTTILGAYVRHSGVCSLESLLAVIRNYVPARVDENVAACQLAYERAGSL